jgi:hypothetical protein
MRQEGTNGSGNRDFEEQLRLGSERTTSGSYRKTIVLEIVKRATGCGKSGIEPCGGVDPLRSGRKSEWGTLVPRINVENGLKLEFLLE